MQGADDGGAKRELRQTNERRVWSRGERNGVKKGGWGGKEKKKLGLGLERMLAMRKRRKGARDQEES